MERVCRLNDSEWWESLILRDTGQYVNLDSNVSYCKQYQDSVRNYQSEKKLNVLLNSSLNLEQNLQDFLSVATLEDLHVLLKNWNFSTDVLDEYISYYLSPDTLIEYLYMIPEEDADNVVYNSIKSLRKEVYPDLQHLFNDLFAKYSIQAFLRNEIGISDFERMYLPLKE